MSTTEREVHIKALTRIKELSLTPAIADLCEEVEEVEEIRGLVDWALEPRVFPKDAQAGKHWFKKGLEAAVKHLRDAAAVTSNLAQKETFDGNQKLGLDMQKTAASYRAASDRIHDRIEDPNRLLQMMAHYPKEKP